MTESQKAAWTSLIKGCNYGVANDKETIIARCELLINVDNEMTSLKTKAESEPQSDQEFIRKIADAFESVLLFHSSVLWDTKQASRWTGITGHEACTTRNLCNHVREVLEMIAGKKLDGVYQIPGMPVDEATP